MFLYPILVSMASLLTSCNNLIMQNTPFNGAGRRLAPHPFLATIPSHTVIYLYFYNPLCVEYVYHVIEEYVAIHEMGMKAKVPVRYAWVGRAGSLPPSPSSVGGAAGGRVGGPGLAWGFWAGKGGSLASKPRVKMADFSGKWIRRVILAGESGRLPRQDILAGHFLAFIWRVILAHLLSGFSQSMKQASFKEKKKKCTISRSVSCIMSLYEYIASNIMLFCSRYRFCWTS